MRKVATLFVGAAAGVALALAGTQFRLAAIGAHIPPGAAATREAPLERFAEALAQVRFRYVEKPDEGRLVAAAISSMVASLENSSYLTAEEAVRAAACARGSGCPPGGLGLDLVMENDLPTVVCALDDSPAAKAGLMARDVIAEIDDEPTSNLSLTQIAAKLAGAVGAPVRLKLARPGSDKEIAVAINREAIAPRQVQWRAEGGDIGYVRIAAFDERTREELKKALAAIAAAIPPARLKGYVVDLRNNPGGPVDAAAAVAGAFLDSGEIVTIRGQKSKAIQRIRAMGPDLARGKPVIVLINAGSAAAAEVVAGALQDNKRATIVGARSFGLGSADAFVKLSAGEGALHLTTGHYFTPSGHLISGHGVAPDVDASKAIDVSAAQPAPKPGADATSAPQPDPGADKALTIASRLLRGEAQPPPAPPLPAPPLPAPAAPASK